MNSMDKLQVIGGGKMGEALLVGLVSNGWAGPGELHVVEPYKARQQAISAAAPGVSVSGRPVYRTDAVIAVKPDVVAEVLPALAAAGVGRVLSIAAGVRTDAVEAGCRRELGGAGHAQHAGACRQGRGCHRGRIDRVG